MSRNVAGLLIGRGALVKPWLFVELKQQRDWDISSSERFDILRRFVNYGLEHWGSDTKGKLKFPFLIIVLFFVFVGSCLSNFINDRKKKYREVESLKKNINKLF